jgi:phage-related protein
MLAGGKSLLDSVRFPQKNVLTIRKYPNIMKGEYLKVIFYETQDHFIPVADFLDHLPGKLRAKTLRSIQLVKEYGTDAGKDVSKCIGDGIYEIRTRQGSDSTRVLYFFTFEDTIVLTNAFWKKSQRTPRKEIFIARKRRDDWVRRNGT